MNIIQEFAEWRAVNKFSLSEVARRMDVNKGHLSEIEHGKRKCTPDIMGKMVIITSSKNSQASPLRGN